MKRLTLLARMDAISGYGQLGIEIVRGLEKLDAHVAVRSIHTWEAWGVKVPLDVRARFVSGLQPEPWEILLHPPNMAPTPGKRTVFFTMWEATRLPPMAVEYLNAAEVVIVPNQWNASCFSAGGVDRPIRVVPLGIDGEVFKYREVPQSLNDFCVFGTAGRMAHGGVRKGLDDVIEAFTEAFPYERDVRLKVKCHEDCKVSRPMDKRIEILPQHLPDPQLAAWYEHIHCFVSAARAEGWGLMQHQAMAVGRPVMTANYGGVREFFQPSSGYDVPFKLGPALHHYKGCGSWAEPDFPSMVASMREVYENREVAIRKGAAAAIDVKGFTWKNTVRKLATVLEEFKLL